MIHLRNICYLSQGKKNTRRSHIQTFSPHCYFSFHDRLHTVSRYRPVHCDAEYVFITNEPLSNSKERIKYLGDFCKFLCMRAKTNVSRNLCSCLRRWVKTKLSWTVVANIVITSWCVDSNLEKVVLSCFYRLLRLAVKSISFHHPILSSKKKIANKFVTFSTACTRLRLHRTIPTIRPTQNSNAKWKRIQM